MSLERYVGLLALVPALGISAAAQGAPADYVLVPQRCQLVAHLLKGRLAAGLGMVRVKDRLTLNIHLVAQRRDGT